MLYEVITKIISNQEFTARWRKNVGNLTGIDTIKFQSDSGGPGSGSSLTIQLNHRDIKTLEQASTQLAYELSKFVITSYSIHYTKLYDEIIEMMPRF